jgi:EAL domain-containing protein (putative c-di-GMP-specific phosphodiesterase class I)
VAPVQLLDVHLAASLLAVMRDVGFDPSRLIVEVTENAMISDTGRASEIFTTLQNAGVRTALDDFGKGYSSLSYLRQLHFDHLKIDRSFVHSMPSTESLSIVSAVAGLGRALGMRVIAEGVESPGVAVALLDLGCEQAQGYFFGRPMPASETIEFASRNAQPMAPDIVRDEPSGEMASRSASENAPKREGGPSSDPMQR